MQPPLKLCDRFNAALRQLKALRRKDMMNDISNYPYSAGLKMPFGSVTNRAIYHSVAQNSKHDSKLVSEA